MPSSLILQGGAVSAKSLTDNVTQAGHGFTVGDVIRWNPTATVPGYTTARADSAVNAEVAGVVSKINTPDSFEVTYHGYIEVPKLSGISAPVWFLSATKGGSLETSPPSAVGTVVKPVLTRNTNGSGHLVMNYLGTQIGGSSTISVDEIQPVGTIIPFAGNAIPDTWLECNGSTYSISAYPELYSKITYSTGVRAPMYGHVVEIQLTTASATLYGNIGVNDYILINNSTSTPTGTGYNIIGRVLRKSTAIPGSYGLTVQVLPSYDPGTKTFAVPNRIVESGNAIAVFSSFELTPITARAGSGAVSTSSMIGFNTPDLRGRFALGTNYDIITDTDRDSSYGSAIGGYTMGAMGGEEAHTLTTSEMPSHTHNAGTLTTSEYPGFNLHRGDGVNNAANQPNTTDEIAVNTNNFARHTHTITGSVAAAGSNTPHNNMPPYLAVRYIIKAKPYTRAAIIDDVEIPYNNLLIRNLKTKAIGGSDADLLFHVNTASDVSNMGLERMRFSSSSGVNAPSIILTASGDDDVTTDVRVRENSGDQFLDLHTSVSAGGWNPLNRVSGHSIIFGSSIRGNASGLTLTIAPWSSSSNGLVLSSDGRLGINTNAPAVALDIVGEARSSISTTSSSNAKTLVTKDYIDGVGLGVGQTWTRFDIGTAANQRANDKEFTNNTGKPIQVIVTMTKGGSNFRSVTVIVDGITIIATGDVGGGAQADYVSFIVPNGKTYKVVRTGEGSISSWAELR